MSKLCPHVEKTVDDLYLCNKYRSYCYLDEPDEKRCEELYNSNNEDYNLLDDEENIEDQIEDI